MMSAVMRALILTPKPLAPQSAPALHDSAAAARPSPPRAESPTLVRVINQEYEALLPSIARHGDVPVGQLLHAIDTQATHSSRLGSFMRLVVRCDAHNTRTVRESWERHGRPAGLRRLLEAEAAAGVQQPARLEEGSAALALLWSMRMKRFWAELASGLSDARGGSPAALGSLAYDREVAPFHGWVLRGTFRAALAALPSREAMLSALSLPPPGEEAAEAEGEPQARREAVRAELEGWVAVLRRVADAVESLLAELGLRDDRRL
mmetsp:Transcript_25781/g.83009  ORF Transcript_25781/g.83009 Transcript_25781/m.83009 type:complete len:264 (+) Transcript_25781:61-852(+)